MDILVAINYLQAGLSVLPAIAKEKRPAVLTWKPYQTRLPSPNDIEIWWKNKPDAVCLICGKVSGNLEVLDFDCEGKFFEPWKQQIPPELFEKLVIETTPSGGKHVAYRCEEPVCGNLKLAQQWIETPDGSPVEIGKKEFVPRKGANNTWGVLLATIETRGEGGLFLCAPSPWYELVQNDFTKLPVLTREERNILLEEAAALNEVLPPPEQTVAEQSNDKPGGDFSQRGDIRAVLQKHGWTPVRTSGERELWRRPGKSGPGCSATLRLSDKAFYVFSSNATPFEPEKSYSPFAVYALLEHGGDFSAAAKDLLAQGYGAQEAPGVDISGIVERKKDASLSPPEYLDELVYNHPTLHRPIIHGLLREGETMNIISASKLGKSWLVLDLALSIATGQPWLGHECEQGSVLILDNELHPATIANRIPKVMEARGIDMASVAKRIAVKSLRGNWQNIFALGEFFKQFEPGQFQVVILDAFYRFLPMKTDENDNGTMAQLYNHLDSYADKLKCCFVLIHHTSKGDQSVKVITDVGAGAGAQSRATDTHLVLRRHEEEGAVVMEAAVRSWPPMPPRCLRWAFPLWTPADDLDPTRLYQHAGRKQPPPMDVDEFVDNFLGERPRKRIHIEADGEEAGLTSQQTRKLLARAEKDGLCFRWKVGRSVGYATVPPPKRMNKEQKILELIADNPNLSNREIAKRSKASIRLVQIVKEKHGYPNGGAKKQAKS